MLKKVRNILYIFVTSLTFFSIIFYEYIKVTNKIHILENRINDLENELYKLKKDILNLERGKNEQK